jgi:hypothetical protein
VREPFPTDLHAAVDLEQRNVAREIGAQPESPRAHAVSTAHAHLTNSDGRRKGAPPEPATKVRVHALVPGAAGAVPGVATVEVELPVDGKAVELKCDKLLAAIQ